MLCFALPFFLATIFLGFALVPVYRYREMPIELLLPLSLPFLFLSGFAWPQECMPAAVRWLCATGLRTGHCDRRETGARV